MKAGRLHFTTSYDEAVAHADAIFIAVGAVGRGRVGGPSHVVDCAQDSGGACSASRW